MPKGKHIAQFLNVLIFLTFSATAQDQQKKLTPDEIREYIEECINLGVRVDLVSRFGTDFRELDLQDINFKGVHQVGKEGNFTGADFTGADLRGTDFGSTRLQGVVFRNANLRGSRFTTAKFDNADLTGAQIGDAHFQECSFTGTKLTGLDFSMATLNGCFYKNANLDDAILQGVQNSLGWRREMAGVSLQRVDLTDFDFNLGTLSGADLSGANLTGVNFEQADLSNANLSDAIIVLDDIVIDSAILQGVTGLDEETLQSLKESADRPGFETQRAATDWWAAFRKSLFNWSYWAVVPLALFFSVLTWRYSREKGWPLIFILINLCALLPALFFYLLTNHEDFLINRSTHRDVGLLWVTVWPLAVLGSLAMIMGGLFLAILFAVRAAKGDKETRKSALPFVAAAILTTTHGALLLIYAFENGPTA